MYSSVKSATHGRAAQVTDGTDACVYAGTRTVRARTRVRACVCARLRVLQRRGTHTHSSVWGSSLAPA